MREFTTLAERLEVGDDAVRPVHPRAERVNDHRVDPDMHLVLLFMKPGANGSEPPRTGPRPDGGTFP